MDTNRFAQLTRSLSLAVSRRASLVTLGGAALAATLAGPDPSQAKKQKGKVCKQKERQRCANDAARCRTTMLSACPLNPDGCEALVACCDACSASGFATCVLAQSPVPLAS
jgi:hypothetical protein